MLMMNFLAALLLFAPGQASDQIFELRKQEFINLLRTLPTKGDL